MYTCNSLITDQHIIHEWESGNTIQHTEDVQKEEEHVTRSLKLKQIFHHLYWFPLHTFLALLTIEEEWETDSEEPYKIPLVILSYVHVCCSRS